MYHKKTLTKWKWFLGSGVIIIVLALTSVLFYVRQHERRLMGYARSLENLPEIQEVVSIRESSGTASYIVARVMRVDGEEFIYFVADDVVVEQVAATKLLSAEAAANGIFGTYEIVSSTLSRYQNRIVYELVANTALGVNYVLVDAMTGDSILSFVID